MGEPAPSRELIDLWASREWRLNNLYWIVDKRGAVTKLRLNEPQRKLLRELHFLNIVLKARQMGFSTFILMLALDCCAFNSNFAAGLVADTLDNAKMLLRRVKFAYERLPEEIKAAVPLRSDNALELVLENGSNVVAGVSLRSGTFNLVHISEYGKICAKFPEKAKEIKAGALNTLAAGQLGFIESTAEGRGGDFYEKTEAARRIADTGRAPKEMEYKFHFFPWYEDASYTLDEPFPLTAEDVEYFDNLRAEHGVVLADGQKWWYAAKKREQGDDMWKEFPSTADEAFLAARDGAYFGKELRHLRQRGLIGRIPFVPGIAVNTFWDFGLNDLQTIWAHQEVAGQNNFVGFYENSGESLAHYFNWLSQWAARRNAVWGQHYAPHDVEHKRQGLERVLSISQMAEEAGWRFETVIRTPDKLNSIMVARRKLPTCAFDEQECAAGLMHLENYSREWDEKFAVWKSHPRHDEHSHAADAYMTFSDGYEPSPKVELVQADVDWVR